MGRQAANKRLGNILNNWLLAEARRNGGHTEGVTYEISYGPDDLALQGDSVSCGVFVCAYLYFKIFHGRWTTRADLSPQSHIFLRMILYDMCMKGRLYTPADHAAGGYSLHADGFAIVDSTSLVAESPSNELSSDLYRKANGVSRKAIAATLTPADVSRACEEAFRNLGSLGVAGRPGKG
jgi:hypothetical protein